MPSLSLAGLLLHCLFMHPVHETISEVQWNAKTSRVEVALRLDVLDEQWIVKQMGKEGAKSDAGRLKYLSRRFRVSPFPKPGQDDQAAYHWIGRQSEGSHAWWFFEIVPPASQCPDWIEIKLLFDHHGNYQHRVVFVDEKPKRSADINRKKPRAEFQPEASIKKNLKATQYE